MAFSYLGYCPVLCLSSLNLAQFVVAAGFALPNSYIKVLQDMWERLLQEAVLSIHHFAERDLEDFAYAERLVSFQRYCCDCQLQCLLALQA